MEELQKQLQEQLNNCCIWFGPNDILTIMVSQKLDKYKNEEQRKLVEKR